METWRKRKGLKSIGLTEAPMCTRTYGDASANAAVKRSQIDVSAANNWQPVGGDHACRVCGYVEHAPNCSVVAQAPKLTFAVLVVALAPFVQD